MPLKIGIDQLTRKNYRWGCNDEQWISMDWVNDGPPVTDKMFLEKDKKWNYGFNDFVLAELTPELCYEETGYFSRAVDLPPFHPTDPNLSRDKNHKLREGHWGPEDSNPVSKHRSCYRTVAYGWGKKADVLDLNSSVNLYCDIEGPEAEDSSSQPFVKFIPLIIPGGLKESDTFWIDLNKGVRALYFPARFKYSNDFPGDAAYAKISFVEENKRNLIDAHELMDIQTFIKEVFQWEIELAERTRKTEKTTALGSKFHVGAYSIDRTLVVNIPQFIDASYLVSTNPTAAPHDSLYLAKSAEIKAKRYATSGWNIPPKDGLFSWGYVSAYLAKSYAGQISKTEQVNLQETTTSDLGAGAEIALNIFVMAASLLPYVGPFIATAGAAGIEALKNVKVDSSAEDAYKAGIISDVWNAAPGEVKDAFVKRLQTELPRILKVVRKK